MLIAWTTVGNREAAANLAADCIRKKLAVCVQIEEGVTSYYEWKGALEVTPETRLCFKFIEAQADALEAHILAHHPYSVPEWIVVRSEHVAEKYLSWATTLPRSSTL
jgi:periplasmic divalent cation tolerance protein